MSKQEAKIVDMQTPRVNIAMPENNGQARATGKRPVKMRTAGVNVFYGNNQALTEIDLDIRENEVTALIGPSGCGKSTFLRCLNRMNDTIPDTEMSGRIRLEGQDIYAPDSDNIRYHEAGNQSFQIGSTFLKFSSLFTAETKSYANKFYSHRSEFAFDLTGQ